MRWWQLSWFLSLVVLSCTSDDSGSEFPSPPAPDGGGGAAGQGTGGVTIDAPVGGFGGAETGGAGGVAGLGGGPATIAGHECSLAIPGATGDEPDGLVPVCCAPTASDKLLIDELFTLLNEHREANGVSPLVYDTALESSIQAHCIHMVLHPFFHHDGPELPVRTLGQRAELCGGTAQGENVAEGTDEPPQIITLLSGHADSNENMLNPDFTRVGIGYYENAWGQLFGAP